MKKQQRRTAQGFTIIEVVLVLAIAGLIFLMVFVALPGLQRSQRDTQRRNDYAALATNVTNYMTNHNGKLPTDCGSGKKFDTTQLNTTGEGGVGADPTGAEYNLKCVTANEAPQLSKLTNETSPEVYVVSKAKCNEDGDAPVSTESKRAFVVYGQLESGTYCNASS